MRMMTRLATDEKNEPGSVYTHVAENNHGAATRASDRRLMTPEEIATKVRASIAFFLKLARPTTPAEIAAFDAGALKARPLRDEQADSIATSIRRKMRQENPDFLLSAIEVQSSVTVASLIALVQKRMP